MRSRGTSGRAGWSADGLVVKAGIDDQVAEEFSGGGVGDADVQVVDEQEPDPSASGKFWVFGS